MNGRIEDDELGICEYGFFKGGCFAFILTVILMLVIIGIICLFLYT